MVTVEGFTWVLEHLLTVPSEITKTVDILLLFSKVFVLLVIVFAVGYRVTDASKRRWTRFKMLCNGVGCVYMVMAIGLLAYYVVKANRVLSYIMENASMLLEEIGKDALQGYKTEEISLLCLYCAVGTVLCIFAAILSGGAFIRSYAF